MTKELNQQNKYIYYVQSAYVHALETLLFTVVYSIHLLEYDSNTHSQVCFSLAFACPGLRKVSRFSVLLI